MILPELQNNIQKRAITDEPISSQAVAGLLDRLNEKNEQLMALLTEEREHNRRLHSAIVHLQGARGTIRLRLRLKTDEQYLLPASGR